MSARPSRPESHKRDSTKSGAIQDFGNFDKYNYFFDNLKVRGVNHDVIGTYYCSYWNKKNVETTATFIKALTAGYKDVLIMETGVNWSPTLSGGWNGQLIDNGPYSASWSSPASQNGYVDKLPLRCALRRPFSAYCTGTLT